MSNNPPIYDLIPTMQDLLKTGSGRPTPYSSISFAKNDPIELISADLSTILNRILDTAGCGRAMLSGPRGALGCPRTRREPWRANRDERASLLGEGGEQVEDKGVYVWTEFGDQEGHLVRHESGDEMNVAAEAV
jgi:hypothetical protein